MSDARGLILLRTHFVDAGIAELARSYAAGGDYDVMIALDETAGEIDAHGCPKLSMSLNSCVRLGLNVAFEAGLRIRVNVVWPPAFGRDSPGSIPPLFAGV